MKNKLPKEKFPSISRLITELFNVRFVVRDLWKKHWKVLVMATSLFLYLGGAAAAYDLYKTYKYSNQVRHERENVSNQIVHWEEVAKKYPGYRDAYFTIAILSYRLGEKTQAKMYLEKALELDPNFEKGRELENLLR